MFDKGVREISKLKRMLDTLNRGDAAFGAVIERVNREVVAFAQVAFQFDDLAMLCFG